MITRGTARYAWLLKMNTLIGTTCRIFAYLLVPLLLVAALTNAWSLLAAQISRRPQLAGVNTPGALLPTLAVAIASCVTFIVSTRWLLQYSPLNMPPGPLPFPVIGHLHLMRKLPHQSLHHLALKFGPLMTIKLGNKTAIVISSKDAAKEVLTTYDRIFASRPVLISPQILCYGCRDIACCEYGPYWRNMRKICTTQLFTAKRIGSFQHIRTDETHHLLHRVILAQSKQQIPVDMKRELSTLTLNVITRMAFGKRFDHAADDSGFLGVILEAFGLMGAVNLGDFIPHLKWLDPGGHLPRLKKTSRQLDSVLQQLVDEHRALSVPAAGEENMVHALLSLGVDDNSIKAVLLDILAAGTDTTAVTTEWALSELIRNGHCLHKAQQEIQNIVGDERLVDEHDLPRLHYLKAVVKETFRLHPAAPMLSPHESIEDCTLHGYKIPKKAWILINVWAIGRSSEIWHLPQEFIPERFLESTPHLDVKGLHFELLPFGSGRRMCAGMSLALCMVEIILARLLQAFNWSLDPHLNMEEGQGVVVAKKYPLLATPQRRHLPHIELPYI